VQVLQQQCGDKGTNIGLVMVVLGGAGNDKVSVSVDNAAVDPSISTNNLRNQ
jgi:hypothetical protein